MATEILELDVKTNIKGVTKEVDNLGKSVKKTAGETEKLGEATEEGAGGFKKVGLAVRAVGAAIKAIGIGMIIAGFVALKEAFMRNQRAADLLNTAMNSVSIVFNEVVDIIIEMIDWVSENREQFEPYIKVMRGLVTFGLEPLKMAFNSTELAIRAFIDGFMRLRKFLGESGLQDSIDKNMLVIEDLQDKLRTSGENLLEAGKDVYENWSAANGVMNEFLGQVTTRIKNIDTKKILELAHTMTEAEKRARKAAVAIAGVIAENDRLAETERRNRDDITKNFEDRIAASEELLVILKEQEKQMLLLVAKEIEAARLASEANKDNLDLELALTQAINKEKEVKAQINGFLTEQTMAHNALLKEEKEIQEEVRLAGVDNRKSELAELDAHYNLLMDKANKVGADTTKIQAKWDKAKADLARENVNAQLEAFSGLAKGLSALAGDNKALAVASALIDTYVGANKAFAQGGVVGYVTAAGVIAAGLANVNKILQTEVPDSGGGGGAPPAATQTPAPQMMSGSFNLENAIPAEPIQAYVVSDDITNNQNKLAIIRRRATI